MKWSTRVCADNFLWQYRQVPRCTSLKIGRSTSRLARSRPKRKSPRSVMFPRLVALSSWTNRTQAPWTQGTRQFVKGPEAGGDPGLQRDPVAAGARGTLRLARCAEADETERSEPLTPVEVLPRSNPGQPVSRAVGGLDRQFRVTAGNRNTTGFVTPDQPAGRTDEEKRTLPSEKIG